MPLLICQVWLSRDIVEEHYLPRHLPEKNLSPRRVAQSMFGLLVEMENPAITPKPLGKFTCWEAGKVRSKKTRKLVLFAT